MYKLKVLSISIILVMVLSLVGPVSNVSARPLAQIAPNLGVASTYSVLAHTGVTNVPTTTVSGDVGSDTATIPATGITYLPPATARTTTEALAAQGAADVARIALEAQGPGTTLASELAGSILPHGVYTVPGVSLLSASVLTGVLTLDGPGVYIFLTDGLTATGTVNFINGADACHVYWRDASSAHINNSGVSGSFAGTIIALTSITFTTGARLEGRAIAQNGNVVLDQNTITGPPCNTTIDTLLSPASITAGGTAYDQAGLGGTNNATATGSVTYNVYSNPTCTSAVYTSAALPIITPGTLPNSPTYSFPTAGTYYWRATYNGDLYNNPSTSACGLEVLTVTAVAAASSVPGTGFAPNRTTVLPVQPASQAYTAMSDLWLEIPKLGVQMNILGVPPSNGTWDVSWLGKNAGWLQGSAFPTWAGNSVITGHVWNANNTVGPFGYLNTLWWGDKVIIHAWGAQYVYEVRSVQQVGPGSTAAMMRHEELPWVTLVTCRGYDQASNSYKYRVLVRAVLVEVK